MDSEVRVVRTVVRLVAEKIEANCRIACNSRFAGEIVSN